MFIPVSVVILFGAALFIVVGFLFEFASRLSGVEGDTETLCEVGEAVAEFATKITNDLEKTQQYIDMRDKQLDGVERNISTIFTRVRELNEQQKRIWRTETSRLEWQKDIEHSISNIQSEIARFDDKQTELSALIDNQ